MRNDFETPFDDAEQAFFCMVEGLKRKNEGAGFHRGTGYIRPGGGLDVQIVIEKLYRQRHISQDHIRVLKFYGVRQMVPDINRPKEERAAVIWQQAMDLIGEQLEKKGMI